MKTKHGFLLGMARKKGFSVESGTVNEKEPSLTTGGYQVPRTGWLDTS